MIKVSIISLGCPRNLIDSEVMAGSLKKGGFTITDNPGGAEVCIINTCAFIGPARDESIDVILETAELKKKGRLKKLVVCGCLSQLYKEKLLKEAPEIDLLVGTSDFHKIRDILIDAESGRKRSEISCNLKYLYDENSPRFLFTPRHYAYIKVSEGCNNRCSYCIIPRLRGNFRSRSVESVVKEVEDLAGSGRLKEINLIGQDTTLFGIDKYGRLMLPYLLDRLCSLDNSIRWIRVLYTHPRHYTDEFIEAVRREDKICKYLDLPLQHISDKVLSRMNRHVTRKKITALIEKLRNRIPGLILRTSLIVGFPGETDKDFKELMGFVRDTKFERLGVFIYSREEGTAASRLKGAVPEKVKKERRDAVMSLQKNISRRRNRSMIGRRMEVLIDEKVKKGKGEFIGRTRGDAPEIDGNVYVAGNNLKIGGFYSVKITDAIDYDLIGKKV